MVHGQTATRKSLADVCKDAMSAFAAGDYPTAIAGLTEVTKEAAPDGDQLEPIYYTLGAAYFNRKDYANAIATFKTYLTQFPKSIRFNEVRFALAQAQLYAGDTAAAKATFKILESNPKYREQALLLHATAAKSTGNPEEAAACLEQLVTPDIPNTLIAKAAVDLASLYIEMGRTDKVTQLIDQLQKHLVMVENVDLDALTLKLGDKLLVQKDYTGALACFRKMRQKDEIIRIQQERIAGMEKRIATNLDQARLDPSILISTLTINNQIRADIEISKRHLADFEKLPPILGALYLRMAQCFYELDQPWNAIVAYQELLDHSAIAKEREPTLYALTMAYTKVNQIASAQVACERYLKEFPNEPNAESINLLRGELALQQKKFDDADNWFASLLEKEPKEELVRKILMLMGNSKFSQGRYDDAIVQYGKYLADFPNGSQVEEAEYRTALALLFGGKYEEATAALNAYLTKYLDGEFKSDAKYRIAVCQYASQQYKEVVEACLEWEKQFPGSSQTGEVLALLADAYAALNQTDDAIQAYQLSYQKAATDEVLNYSLFEASKLLQKEGRWAEVSTMFENFVKEKPENPTVLGALFWIGRAKAKEGRSDEAKQFLAETVKKYINDPAREPVEQILTQLAQLCAKKSRPAELANSGTATPVDPVVQLDALLGISKNSPTAEARVLFARSELARLCKQPDKQQQAMGEIAAGFKPDDLSPLLLGLVGDHLLAEGKTDRAAQIYTYLMDYYPKSPQVDYAYAGLGEIALAKEDYPTALKYFTDGTEKIVPNTKIKDLTLGRAQALLALDRLDEAKKLFEQVASVREWRGEATAMSIYSLGEIQWRQSKWAEANVYYQRIFVTYRKYLPWMARSYLRSMECFTKLGKTQEAINTLNEMLSDAKLASLPEAKMARQRLQELSPQ